MSEVKVCLIYGSDSGNTEDIANKIKADMSVRGYKVDLYDIEDAEPDKYKQYDFLIMGIPTWDYGGIQRDWECFEDNLLKMDLNGKVVALYGLGDQYGYAEWFLDAMGWLHERLVKCGAKMIGYWSTEGYEYEGSLAVNEEKTQFCGLAIDQDCQREMTDERIDNWLDQIVAEYIEYTNTSSRQASL